MWVFSGDEDKTVARAVVDSLVATYARWVPPASLRYVKLPGGHAMVSVAAAQANACATTEPPYINRCGDFDTAGQLLEFLLGPLATRQSPPQGPVARIRSGRGDGRQAADIGLADTGYVFVPSACVGGGCKGGGISWLPSERCPGRKGLCRRGRI